MIEYIKGRIEALTPAQVVIETSAGVAYMLNITLPSFSALEGKSEGRLYVHEVIRDDAWILYGFIDEAERTLFRNLIGVSGVGASTAAIILSSLQGDELSEVIAAGNVRRLKAIKGIGSKTAERIIVDLRDKIKSTDTTLSIKTAARNDAYDEAFAALTILGVDKKQSDKDLTALFKADPDLKVEAAIKKAMSMM